MTKNSSEEDDKMIEHGGRVIAIMPKEKNLRSEREEPFFEY